MSIQAPPRGVLLGRSYLAEDDAIEVIRDLRDGSHLFSYFQARLAATDPAGGLSRRLVRSQVALLRVLREMEDALGSSADE
jgi:hypothetical protein